MGSAAANAIKQCKRGLLYAVFVIESRLAEFVLMLLLVFAPIGVTALYEATLVDPVEPSAYCVSLIASDGDGGWAGPVCFASELGAHWYRKLIELPAAISADCEVMTEKSDKDRCQERKDRLAHALTINAIAGVIGYSTGSVRSR